MALRYLIDPSRILGVPYRLLSGSQPPSVLHLLAQRRVAPVGSASRWASCAQSAGRRRAPHRTDAGSHAGGTIADSPSFPEGGTALSLTGEGNEGRRHARRHGPDASRCTYEDPWRAICRAPTASSKKTQRPDVGRYQCHGRPLVAGSFRAPAATWPCGSGGAGRQAWTPCVLVATWVPFPKWQVGRGIRLPAGRREADGGGRRTAARGWRPSWLTRGWIPAVQRRS